MATNEAIDFALRDVLPKFSVETLIEEQFSILKCLLERKDCMAVLPTGFGKSLPFQIYLSVMKAIECPPVEMQACEKPKVLVCCPLVSLMQDQVTKLSKVSDITAAYKGSSCSTDKLIQDGCVDYIYASPETLVGDPVWRSHIQKLNVSLIVIDEFHTIATWGEDCDGTEKQAFRKWFSCIGELRSDFPNSCVLALSATCTTKIRKRVMKILNFKTDNIVEVTVSPNKSNIKLVVSKIPNELEMAMAWLVDGLGILQKNFPRTMIYCRSILDISKLYTYIVRELPQCVIYVDMFHSETTESKKNNILEKLADGESDLRVVLASSALGMGVDVENVQSVVLYGPPNNVVDMIQEIGRVGRN